MIGTRQMERVLSEAERAGAKVILVGDAEQLQAIEAGAAFRSLAERYGAAEISDVRRQHEDWQNAATRALATVRTGEAIHAYAEHGMVHSAETREAARLDEHPSELQSLMHNQSYVICLNTNTLYFQRAPI